MRRILTIFATLALLTAFLPTEVSADTWGPGCQEDKDLAMRVWVTAMWSGDTDFECGQWTDLPNHIYVSMPQYFADTNWGNDNTPGSIEGMNDKVSAWRIWNTSDHGACFGFYENAGYWGKHLAFWAEPHTQIIENNLNAFGANDQITSVIQETGVSGRSRDDCEDFVW
jgi:hypothetical protein